MSVKDIQDAIHIHNEEKGSITLLAIDPYWLYVYWDMPVQTKNTFLKEFGREIWDKSIPALKVTNITRNKCFYVRINDFSDNWYINVPDPGNTYTVEIGRQLSNDFFIGIFNSNSTVTPGNSVSNNTVTYFTDYIKLRTNKFMDIPGKEYDYNINLQKSTGTTGLSSIENAGLMQENKFNMESSAVFYSSFSAENHDFKPVRFTGWKDD